MPVIILISPAPVASATPAAPVTPAAIGMKNASGSHNVDGKFGISIQTLWVAWTCINLFCGIFDV
jgi:hypothetical protein